MRGETCLGRRSWHADGLAIVDPLPAWRAFGPNGRQVMRLLELVAAMDEQTARNLVEHCRWSGPTIPPWPVGRLTARGRLSNAISRLVRETRGRRVDGAWEYLEVRLERLCETAGLALVMRDCLSVAVFSRPYECWGATVGEPG
jgi:hypothetical protein